MFKNRVEAGRLLSDKLIKYRGNTKTAVLSIPRGGIVVGQELAKNLNLPLTYVVVKKLRAPGNPELAIGALAPDGVKVIDWELALKIGVEQEYLDEEIERKQKEVEERTEKFLERSNLRGGSTSLKDKNFIILTDDGVATGATVLAAIKYIKNLKPTTYNLSPKIILAVPVVAKDTFDKLKSEVDEIIALEIPDSFSAVGQFYEEFPQVTDEEVIKML